LVTLFGDEKRANYDLTENLRKTVLDADYKNNKAIEFHMSMNLYPTMAYYKALRNMGYNEDDTLIYIRKETIKAAEIKKSDQAKVANMPCTYLMYRLFVKGIMKKNFRCCWKRNGRCDRKEIHFILNMNI
jgi:hypothetical protein